MMALSLLAGCGGGGGGGNGSPDTGAVAAPVVASGSSTDSFLPNYVSSLTATRRWSKTVVTVRVVPPSADSTGAVPDMVPLVQQAIALWGQKVGGDVNFQILGAASIDPADVTISWVTPDGLPADSIGRTNVQFRTADQILTSAQVIIARSLPSEYQVQVIAHELGHALGIDGHSKATTDLMFTNAHLPALITQSDQNTILWSYKASQTGRSTSSTASSTSGTGIGSVETVCGIGH